MSKNIVVLKFGSSVLRSADNIAEVIGEIGRYLNDGQKVVAVVSAFEGRTDELIALAIQRNLNIKSEAYARLVSSGEDECAAELHKTLKRKGRSSGVLSPLSLKLLAKGHRGDSSPESVDLDILNIAIFKFDVIIVPGFAAINEKSESVLLGRGGSDLTAIYLAYALGVNSARLIKDVDGLYTRDPNLTDDAERYTQVSWKEALLVAGSLIQPKAIEFARKHNVEIKITSSGKSGATKIGDYKRKFDCP